VYGSGSATLRTGARGRLRVTVPALSAVVYASSGRIPASEGAPSVFLGAPQPSAEARSRMEVRAEVGTDSFYEVTFEARVGGGDWQSIGTDDTAPYRVFHDVSGQATGTALQYRAIVLDNAGHTRTSRVRSTEVAAPRISIDAPREGARVRGEVRLLASTDPERASQTVTFQRRVGTGAWTTVATDTSSPAYTAVDDISGLGLGEGEAVRYRAVLTEADGNEVVSRVRTLRAAPTPVTTAVIHYRRPAGDYADWGLHLWGDAVADEVLAQVTWERPWPFTAIDDFGARFEVPLKDDTKPLNYIIHLPGRGDEPVGREPGGDRRFIPLESPEVWIVQGDPTIHTSRPPGT